LPRRSKDGFFWIRFVHAWFWIGLLSHKAKNDKKKAHAEAEIPNCGLQAFRHSEFVTRNSHGPD
jgi:hypothetical protein